MGVFNDFMFGFSAYGKAIELIFKKRLYFYFLIPLVLNILLLGTTFTLVGNFTDYCLNLIQATINPESWDFWGSNYLESSIKFIVNVLLYFFFFLIYAFLGGYVILIILSPVLSIVSEKTENIVFETDYPFSWLQILKDSWRGIVLALRNFMIETIAIIALFIFSFIPIIGFLSTPILFLVSAYFYGFSFIDYTSERRKLNSKESIAFVKQNKGLAIGNGIPFAICLLIPVIGISIAGFVAIISTVSATLSIFQKEKIVEQNSN